MPARHGEKVARGGLDRGIERVAHVIRRMGTR
jgi:hypothetical protein